MKVVAYSRVSTDNQKEEGTIRVQQEAIKQYCQSKNLELVTQFSDEGVSGSLSDRPGLAALISYLEANKAEINALVIWKLDRLARDLYIQEHLLKKLEELNVLLISTKEPDLNGSDPMRKAFRQFLGIVAELEKSFITMRLSGGRLNKAQRGGYAGGRVPFGYQLTGSGLQPDPEQSLVIQRIYHLKRYRKLSLNKIACTLNQEGVTSPSQGMWYASSVKYLLENPLYRGHIEYSGIRSQRKDLALV